MSNRKSGDTSKLCIFLGYYFFKWVARCEKFGEALWIDFVIFSDFFYIPLHYNSSLICNGFTLSSGLSPWLHKSCTNLYIMVLPILMSFLYSSSFYLFFPDYSTTTIS